MAGYTIPGMPEVPEEEPIPEPAPPPPPVSVPLPPMAKTSGGEVEDMLARYRGPAPAERPMISSQVGPDTKYLQSVAPAAPTQPAAPPIQQGYMRPAGFDKSRLPWQANTLKGAEEGIEKHEAAATKAADALSAQQEAIAKIRDKSIADSEARALQQAEIDKQRQDAYTQQSKQYQAALDAAANGTVDPDRWMHSQSTGTRILMAIGAGLGGFVNAKTGAPNPMIQMVQKSIDRDIQAQEHDLATKRYAAGSKLNALGELRAQGMDARLAANALEQMHWKNAEEQIKATAAHTDSPVIQANKDEALASINDKRTALDMQADELMHHNAQFVGAQGLPKTDMGKVFTSTDGQQYMARNEESRKILAASNATVSNIHAALDDYKSALKNVGATDIAASKVGYMTPAMSAAFTAYNHALSPMRQAQDDGVWKKGEVEMLAQTLTPPDHISGDPIAQANLAQRQAAETNARLMKVESALPVQTGFAQTPTGQLAPSAAYTGKEQKPLQVGMPSSFRAVGK